MYLEFLKQNRDVFVWSYSEILGLDLAIAIHHLALLPDRRPVKQAPKCMHADLAAKVEAEVDKLITAKFIRDYITRYGWPISFPSRRKMGKPDFASTSEILIRLAQKTTCQSPM